MQHSSMATDADMIAFEASKLMRGSGLDKHIKCMDYDAFRQHFQQVSGKNVKHSLVDDVNLIVERLFAGVNSHDLDEAKVDGNIVSEDLVMYLKDNNWGTANIMWSDNIIHFLGQFSIQFCTAPSISSCLTFKIINLCVT